MRRPNAAILLLAKLPVKGRKLRLISLWQKQISRQVGNSIRLVAVAGTRLPWLEREFNWSDQQARNLMRSTGGRRELRSDEPSLALTVQLVPFRN
jgi:hypothetical protein